jgi:hypothetical protein
MACSVWAKRLSETSSNFVNDFQWLVRGDRERGSICVSGGLHVLEVLCPV